MPATPRSSSGTFVEEALTGAATPDFAAPDQIHAALARFRLPLYVTTNYDGYMSNVLEHAGKRPTEVISSWFDSDPVSRNLRKSPPMTGQGCTTCTRITANRGRSCSRKTFLVLFRTLLFGLLLGQHRQHVSVQVDPGEREPG